MSKEFENKVVLVTGASKGIGAAIARLFAQKGALVVVNYLHSESLAKSVLQDIRKHSDGMIIKCDVTNNTAVRDMISTILKEYGRIDVLINNVGTYLDGDEWDGDVSLWRQSIDLNLISTLNVSKYVAKEFIKRKTGVIVNIASRYAYMGHADSITYAACKAGIVNITQSYAKLLSPFGRANAVSPGATDAGYWKRAPKDELKEVKANSPFKTLIRPEEIANVVVFLASDKASKVNGQDLLVDGGK